MKKSIVAKILVNVLFVLCSMWFLFSCYNILLSGNNMAGILNDKKYEETDALLDNLRTYAYSLEEFISFQESYCKDFELDSSRKINKEFTIEYVFENLPFEMIREQYENYVFIGDYNELNNQTYHVNGHKLTYSELQSIHTFYERYNQYQATLIDLGEENTNFRYYFQWVDVKNKEHIYRNTEESIITGNKYYIQWIKEPPVGQGKISVPKEKISGLKQDSYIMQEIRSTLFTNSSFAYKSYNIIIAVDADYPAADDFSQARDYYQQSQKWIGSHIKSFLFSLGGMLILLSIMIISAGYKKGYDGVYLTKFDKWYTEFGFIATVIGIIIPLACISGVTTNSPVIWYNYKPQWYMSLSRSAILEFAIMIFLVFISIEVAVHGLLSLIRRVKAGTVVSNSLAATLSRGIKSILTPKGDKVRLGFYTLIGFLLYLVINFILFIMTIPNDSIGGFLFLELIFQMITLVVIIKFFDGYNEIYNGTKEISKGKLEYKIKENIPGSVNREMAKAINNIGAGLGDAVESSIKNERLKTDLITNVSHDIKTPLTSIMNYVELLKRENIDNERVENYIKILENKADRLKNLTEDLVEASKLSSGVIQLNITKLNVIELINQVNGEFEEKFETKDLILVCDVPNEPVVIEADGRRMWRILENIYNNAYKYALSGTRVYVNVTSQDRKVTISVKNISENQLNFDASELTERFIRGDVSRSSEGSGLGLSIVRSLVDLHGGKLDIQLDGDLFKVIVEFNEKRFT